MKSTPAILPKNMKILKNLGEHILLARLRRKLSAEQIAERTGLGRKDASRWQRFGAGSVC